MFLTVYFCFGLMVRLRLNHYHVGIQRFYSNIKVESEILRYRKYSNYIHIVETKFLKSVPVRLHSLNRDRNLQYLD